MSLRVLSLVMVSILSVFLFSCAKEIVDEEEIDPYIFVINFDTNGGSDIPTMEVHNNWSLSITDPVKENYSFSGWYLDEELTIDYVFSSLEPGEITLYAKWVEEIIEEIVVDNTLATDELSIHSSQYGNTNGNLNNQGLAVYDGNLGLHYYSYGSDVYAYNPETDETSLVFTLEAGGRATYLNLDGEVLYYINSSNGYLMSYHLIDKLFLTISDKENVYASRTQSWINFIYPDDSYGETYMFLQRYITDTETYSSTTTGIEQLNIDGTRAYFKPVDSLQLRLMNYSGNGKYTIIDLATLDVEIIHESLLLDVDNDYVAYYALILTVDNNIGLYTYSTVDGLVKIMDAGDDDLHSLNYDGTSLFVINGSSALYKITLETSQSELLMNLPGNDTNIQIINNWIYIGTSGLSTLYRINPATNEIEYLD